MIRKIDIYRLLQIPKTCFRDARDNVFGQLLPMRPIALNLLANDICNSRCRMCNVWKQERAYEITPDELFSILKDPLFSSISYVGISGGEPTLRKDLPEFCDAVIRSIPMLKGLGIITNAINRKDVIHRLESVASVCKDAGVSFNVMVSLDGIGDVHDNVRGRKGNFLSSISVIRHFMENSEISVTAACTIIKENVWHVDEVLDYCIDNGVRIRFRMAEFIKRLYNEDLIDSIRNFTYLEAFHLGLFFFRLEYAYEKSPSIKRTYRNIRRMIMNSESRKCGCIFTNKAVTLDCRGRLLYCSPRSPVLGDCRKIHAEKLYYGNIDIRRGIVKDDCASCIHDYTAEETIHETCRELWNRLWRKLLSLNSALIMTKAYRRHSRRCCKFKSPSRFLIIGWYGTETAGDKAILAEIIHQINIQNPFASICLSTLFPDYSRPTIKEMGFQKIKLIQIFSYGFVREIAKSDEIIIGGGPLMHIEEIGVVLMAFFLAKRMGKRTRIAGCGIGPLDRGSHYAEAVKRILYLSDRIELRDHASARWAKEKADRADVIVSGDYAQIYALKWAKGRKIPKKRNYLNLYLRDLTAEYKGNIPTDQFVRLKERFEEQLSEMIYALCRKVHLQVRLLSMHHFVIGGDDRIFNRRFAVRYLENLNPIVEIQPFSTNELLWSMYPAALSLCMRFHSVLFAHTLGLPYIAIDYSQGGKIYHFLNDHDALQSMLSVDSIVQGNWHTAVDSIAESIERGNIRKYYT